LRRDLAVELLKKLLGGELKVRRKKNVVQARPFSEMLEQALQAYKNRAITTHEVIEELIRLRQEMRTANVPGDKLGLNEEEAAFYDAPAANQSAVQVLGDKQLAIIARELVDKVKQNATIDWTIKETVRAKLCVMVRRILKKYGYVLVGL